VEEEMFYALGLCLIVAQALYIRLLFEGFRRKVYLDVMDFLIERRKKEKDSFVDDETSATLKRSHLKLVRRD